MKRTYKYEMPEVRLGSLENCSFICSSINELDSLLEVDEIINITDDPELNFDND